MTRATVAYENAREAKRKLKAVRPLRWHREREGLYKARGVQGEYTIFHRSPNRRKGIFPWVATKGGVKGPELKPGGWDRKDQAQLFAAQVDAGLCGTPAVVVQAPSPAGLPVGVYKGTVAGEAKRTPYFDKVEQALRQMDAGGLGSESSSYVSSMEAAGVDPTIVASVLVATHQHRHDHNCVGKHVELAEGAREGRREDLVFRGQRAALLDLDGSWGYSVAGGPVVEGFVSRDAAKAAAMQAMGMPAGFSMAVEGGAEEAKKRLPQPDPSSGYYITHSSLTQDLWLMHENVLVARSTNRDELLRKAEELGSSSEAAEARRPKGPRRR